MYDHDPAHPRSLSLEQLPPELGQRVRAELQDGERLVWLGQPRLDLYSRATGCLVIFGIFFTLFALVWVAMALGIGFAVFEGAPGRAGVAGVLPAIFSVCGLPFGLVGIVMLTSPLWYKKLGARVVYGLTDRRAILWEPRLFGGATVRSFTASGLGQMTRVENADGSGSLVFSEYTTYDGENYRRHQNGFLYIDNVRGVEALVRETLLGAR
jgi:hypothetical protein